MWTLGINWNFHDASAALVDEHGTGWAMAEEERFPRSKHAWGDYPVRATAYCLETAGISPCDLGHVAVGWDMNVYEPWLESGTTELFERLFGPKPVAASRPELVFVDHHLAHALVSFHGSAFERAAVLVMDGSGERASISIFAADRSGGLELKRSWGRTNSLGAMYESATQAIGFGPLEGGKVMGLAPYAPTVVDDLVLVDALLEGSIDCPPWHAPGSDPEDDACVEVWRAYYEARFGSVTRDPDDLPGDPVALLIAAGAQRAVEVAGAALHAEARRITGVDAVCLSGGVALNCVSNGRLPEPLYVPPMPHDSGVALGAAWHVNPPSVATQLSPFLGTDIDGAAPHDDGRFVVGDADPEAIVDLLVQGAIGAVAEGRAE